MMFAIAFRLWVMIGFLGSVKPFIHIHIYIYMCVCVCIPQDRLACCLDSHIEHIFRNFGVP